MASRAIKREATPQAAARAPAIVQMRVGLSKGAENHLSRGAEIHPSRGTENHPSREILIHRPWRYTRLYKLYRFSLRTKVIKYMLGTVLCVQNLTMKIKQT